MSFARTLKRNKVLRCIRVFIKQTCREGRRNWQDTQW